MFLKRKKEKKKKLVCLFIPTLDPGGAERVLCILANGLIRNNFDVKIIVVYNADLNSCIYPLDDRITVIKMPDLDKTLYGWKKLWAHRKFFLSLNADIMIGFLWHMNHKLALSLLFCRTPIILSERSDMNYDLKKLNKKGLTLLYWGFRHANAYVLQTQTIKQYMTKSHWKIPEKIIHVIPNPVRSVPKDIICGPRSSKKIAAMGRLDKQKGFDILLEAFAKLATKYPDWSLSIHGTGEEYENLLLQQQQLNLNKQVEFPGLTRNSYNELSKADIFVLSSRCEGFPNVLLEAMAVGKAVIAFDCKYGPAEIIKHDSNGILVPAECTDMLADALENLIINPEKRQKLGEAAKKVVEVYKEEKIIDLWINLINKLVQK